VGPPGRFAVLLGRFVQPVIAAERAIPLNGTHGQHGTLCEVPMEMNVAVLFDDIAKHMLQFFDGWETRIPHHGEKGGVRERRVGDFLTVHLPRKYGVGSGHIIDKDGNVSLQEDIVIYDRANSPTLEIDSYYQVYPCETVYAAVEVKSLLDSAEIEKCIRHAERLGQMNRRDLGPIESFVFAYDCCESKTEPAIVWARNKFMEKASKAHEQRPIPSLVLCLKRSFLLHFGIKRTEYIADSLDYGILLYFFDHVLVRLSGTKTSSPSLLYEYGWEKANPIRRLK
jgi:hypothetical protein